jgi:hypothetical protein
MYKGASVEMYEEDPVGDRSVADIGSGEGLSDDRALLEEWAE